MKLQHYITKQFKTISDVDYVDVSVGGKYAGQHTASLTLKGRYLSLDSMRKSRRAKNSYCFPMDTLIEVEGGQVKFDYCGTGFELTLFKG